LILGDKKMEDQKELQENQTEPEEPLPYEEYGWEFHKRPLLYALILTVLFYAFITFYVNL